MLFTHENHFQQIPLFKILQTPPHIKQIESLRFHSPAELSTQSDVGKTLVLLTWFSKAPGTSLEVLGAPSSPPAHCTHPGMSWLNAHVFLTGDDLQKLLWNANRVCLCVLKHKLYPCPPSQVGNVTQSNASKIWNNGCNPHILILWDFRCPELPSHISHAAMRLLCFWQRMLYSTSQAWALPSLLNPQAMWYSLSKSLTKIKSDQIMHRKCDNQTEPLISHNMTAAHERQEC